MAAAGIHFGNTNSVISVCRDSKITTVSNETGDRVTPTIVGYTGMEKVIGQPAKHFLIRNPQSCISNIKASIGKNFTDESVAEMKKCFSSEVGNSNGRIFFRVKVDNDMVNVRSTDATSYIFTKLLEIAEHVGGADLEDVVLTVPVTFSEEQRILLSDAAEAVGCNVLRIISEPAAALLAYGLCQEDILGDCRVLVFRLGGTSADATIMNINSGMYRFVGQKEKQRFGGKNFDEELVKHLVQEFKRKSKADITDNKRAVGKLRAAIEECKHGLTNMTSNGFAVDSLYEGMDFSTQLIRAKFESICNSLFLQCTQLVDELLQAHSFTEKDIDKVIFVGGGARMPRLLQMFKTKFKTSEVLNHINPEEVLAQGAAFQASLLQGRDDTAIDSASCSLDALSKNIGIKVVEDNIERLEVMLSKFTPVPARRTKVFEGHPDQTSVCLSLHESDDTLLENSRCLAKIVMKNIPGDTSKEFTLNLEINRSGTLVATLTEKHSGQSEHVTIQIHNS